MQRESHKSSKIRVMTASILPRPLLANGRGRRLVIHGLAQAASPVVWVLGTEMKAVYDGASPVRISTPCARENGRGAVIITRAICDLPL